jgi:flagellar basal body rod protein FlgB
VDIDTEMTTLATNDLSYRMATRLLSMRYSLLRGAIKGRVG